MAQRPDVVVVPGKEEETDEGSYEPGWYSVLKETAEAWAAATSVEPAT